MPARKTPAYLRSIRAAKLVLLALGLSLHLAAAERAQLSAVPGLVKFSGALNEPDGRPMSEKVTATFKLYKDQFDTEIVWSETQEVLPDQHGKYTVVLGSTAGTSVSESFSRGEARWLGVESNGVEQPRVLIVTVPYAFRAGDSDSLGGRPAGAYVLREQLQSRTITATPQEMSAVPEGNSRTNKPPVPGAPNSALSGESSSLDVSAGTFTNNAGGPLLVGRSNGNQFRVDANGRGYFNDGTQVGGADFAESVAITGRRQEYQPGDVLVIAPGQRRTLALAEESYSPMVAGIYSTKPGVLATPHSIDQALTGEVPLAVVGIVPCKVTTSNGPVHTGDLLVTSSKPGFAMKGTRHKKMLGAVVGKALESLESGDGMIEVLVSLQ